MQKNHATITGIVVFVAMTAGIMYGVRAGNPVVSVFSFLAGAVLISLLKRGVDSVIEDEWTRLVEQKTANLTMNVTSILFAIIGLVLITISGPGQNFDQAVFAIAGFLITLAIVHIATTIYYSHILRGNGP
jgi:uncharacterized membrane protein